MGEVCSRKARTVSPSSFPLGSASPCGGSATRTPPAHRAPHPPATRPPAHRAPVPPPQPAGRTTAPSPTGVPHSRTVAVGEPHHHTVPHRPPSPTTNRQG